LAGEHGRVLSHEDDLPRLVHSLTPEGMAMADAACLVDTAEAMATGTTHIVAERVFAQAHTMRELTRLAAQRGYEVGLHEPKTEWARDPEACLAKTSRSISTEDMQYAANRWEMVRTPLQVLASRTPTERLSDAKDAWAELAYLKEQGHAGSDTFVKKFQDLTTSFAPEVQQLHYLKFFDAEHQEQIKIEMAQRLSRMQLKAEPEHFSTPAEVELDEIAARVAALKPGPVIDPERKLGGPDLG
jgi:hypothetical protein